MMSLGRSDGFHRKPSGVEKATHVKDGDELGEHILFKMALCANPNASVLAGSSWTRSPWLFRLVSRSSQLYTRMLHDLTFLTSWGDMFLPKVQSSSQMASGVSIQPLYYEV